MSEPRCVKRRYAREIDAMIALSSSARSRSARRNEVRTYRCPRCKGWHLTSASRGRSDV